MAACELVPGILRRSNKQPETLELIRLVADELSSGEFFIYIHLCIYSNLTLTKPATERSFLMGSATARSLAASQTTRSVNAVGNNFQITLDERQPLAIDSAGNDNRNVLQLFADISFLDAVHDSYGGSSEKGESQGNNHLVKAF